MEINIGLNDSQRKAIADGLSKVLADSYSLYIKTHNYHWNVTGPQFNALHTMFESQYTELAPAIDEIAERIRALGHLAPGSYKEFSELTSIKDGDNRLTANEMVKELVEGQETVARTCRSLISTVDEAGDEPTADLLTVRMQTHEKNAWMLRAMLANN
ncbi:Dps family protein [Suttonella indologenes]|uniref:DNA protection during starvation protein 2 n=1 Tax=Suttonella indologenes TaxID=13276 RepID=A0A380MW87_9GAMM|nr:Dps family protein [Suttonella indologenes]SUO96316.1 DNA protection during starvation protein 2 [Suttonella indologenes]